MHKKRKSLGEAPSQGRWVDVTRKVVAARIGWAKDENLSRKEIEAVLDDVVPGVLKQLSEGEPPPGFHILWLHGLEHPQQAGPKRNSPPPSEAKAAALVELAKTDAHAFDAAGYLAAKHFVKPDCPPSLRRFALSRLVFGLERPQQSGRPHDGDQLLRMAQYSLCLLVAENSRFSLSRNPLTPKDATSFSACDAVAEAFKRAGRRTTMEHLASLCYDKAHREVRASALLCLMAGPTSGRAALAPAKGEARET